MRIVCFILFFIETLALTDFEKCIKNNGKTVARTICKPNFYDADTLPTKPMLLKPTITFGGVRNLNENSMTLMIWLNVNWNDPGKAKL